MLTLFPRRALSITAAFMWLVTKTKMKLEVRVDGKEN